MQAHRTPSPAPPLGTSQSEQGLDGFARFEGFDPPESNFWRLPNNWFDVASCFTSWAEHKVVEYILRHTWGYQEYDICKLITMDEFMHGRKRRDGTRIDAGIGMAENSIKKGIADAVSHGFLVVEVDDSDRGRIKKFYGPRMRRVQRDEGDPASRPLTPYAVAAPPPQHLARNVRSTTATAHSEGRQDQRLRVEGQSLTPGDHVLPPQPQALTLQDQRQPARDQRLTRSASTPDPRTEETPRVIQVLKDTEKKHNTAAAATTAPAENELTPESGASLVTAVAAIEEPAAEPAAADLIALLSAEGIALNRARSLVQHYPPDRILRQLRWIDARKYQHRSATLIAAIERDYEAPPGRRAEPDASGSFDHGKFYRGAFALCPQCGCRPCLCQASEPARTARLR